MGGTARSPAKDRFTALDTLALVRELRAILPARIDKVYDLPGAGFDLLLRVPRTGRRWFRIVPGRYAALLESGEDHAEELSPFARELRRLLSGAPIVQIPDPAGERAIELELRAGVGGETLRLILELFGTGNLLVVRGDRVVAVLHPRAWAHRTLRIGAEYKAPPRRADPISMARAELVTALEASRTDRVTTLAARLAMGGPLAEELLVRSQLSPSVPAPEDAENAAGRLGEAAGELLGELTDQPRGYLYRAAELPVDVVPYASRRWRADPEIVERQFDRFSDAVIEYFRDLGQAESTPPPDPRREELLRQRSQQSRAIQGLEQESTRLQQAAETLLARMPEVEAKLATLGVEDSESTTEIELDGIRIPLLPERTLRESAQALFEERKRIREKLEGAVSALTATDAALAGPSRSAPKERATRPTPGARAQWFEKYRWFVSSEGILVVGGRDASSNDRIVKRYLRPKDRYIHADVHGAASVVAKHPEGARTEIGDLTLREAAQWALTFSKVWRAGRATGDAFWVEADQVSKAGASGEFVPRGAWVIHGQRNPLRDLPVEIGLGTISLGPDEKWCAAPPSALRSRGTLRWVLTPGEERDRPALEIQLSREAGISRTLLQALLPAGGIRAERRG